MSIDQVPGITSIQTLAQYKQESILEMVKELRLAVTNLRAELNKQWVIYNVTPTNELLTFINTTKSQIDELNGEIKKIIIDTRTTT